MLPPLLVHLIFHPESLDARTLASDLNDALNTDAALPGLRVPTQIVPEDGSGLPPDTLEFAQAQRHLMVVLADDYMVLESTLPAGRQSWASFVGNLWKTCAGDETRRFLPMQLSDAAWPLDPRLAQTNFVRAVDANAARRTQAALRRLLVESIRFLAGTPPEQDLPLTVFLSHAKADIALAPKVYEEVCEHLNVTQVIKTWIDSAEISGGSRFSTAIKEGVEHSLLLVLATRSHGSRTWCRKEILLAKRFARPFVVIEALDGIESRTFPYGGNAPKMRWQAGAAGAAVDLLLKEALRHRHVGAQLEGLRRPGDVVFSAAPELATLVGLPSGTPVLYPDPPLGDEEIEQLAPLNIRVETPLQRAAAGLRLSGVQIVISCSESEDAARHGALPQHLDAALLEISRQLLVRGATLEYGGHLGKDGYTVALFDMAAAYSDLSGLPPAARVINDVGWPLPLKSLLASERAKYAGVATLRRIGRPEGLADLEPETFIEEPKFFRGDDSAVHRYAWARGMTAMREFQAGLAAVPGATGGQARIVLGGKIGPPGQDGKWYVSRIPGVVEEVLCSLRGGQPLYLLGAFGGAAALAIDLIEGRPRADFTWDYHRRAPYAEPLRALYQQRGVPWEDYPEMTEFLAQVGMAGLARQNGLSVEENRELFVCRDVARMIELILLGLQRVGVQAPGPELG